MNEPERLQDVFCFRPSAGCFAIACQAMDEGLVGPQLAFSYERKRIILEENEVTRGLPGKYVNTYAFPNGQFEVRTKGVSLPYTVFDKDQRVTHAAITENKHLSAVLEHIKAEQDKVPPKARPVGTQRTRYEPTGRRNTEDWNSKLARRAKAKADAASAQAAE